MTLAQDSSTDRAEVLAVDALDDIAAQLIRAHGPRVPCEFLDWIGLEATLHVRSLIRHSMKDPGFARQMQSSVAESTVRRLVHRWLAPQLRARFNALLPPVQVGGDGAAQPQRQDAWQRTAPSALDLLRT
ncbi:MAG: hypothetical protein KF796_16090 [Ramlibacter sp.]|nr:hypothetical protein [Ramlibacter sp.]